MLVQKHCLSYLSCLAVYSLLFVQNKSVKYKEALLSQTFDNQLKLNKHISLILLNSFCHRLNNLGDFI